MARPDPLVDVLLAPMAVEVCRHQREGGIDSEQIASALADLAHAVVASAAD
ncbi:hypothetical protein [Nocardia fusca]|uniref:TetR family transcriptional regulator n=1 Tax=Nocardia fusca TaxID=941183 RepID=A0ABV3FI74_9NOCA